MRSLHSTLALALTGLLAGHGLAAAQPIPPTTPNTNQLLVFLQGAPAGNEDVTVTRTPEGTTIRGTARLGAPATVTVRRAEIRYAPDGSPLGLEVEGSVRERLVVALATVSGNTVSWSLTEGARSTQKSFTIEPGAILLPPIFLGSYEAFAWRLPSMKPGDSLPVVVPGQGQIPARLLGASDEQIQTPAGVIRARRSRVEITEADKPVEVDVWSDAAGRLVRLSVPSQGLEVVRSDVATVAARQVQVSRPNDEVVRVPANGFTIAATVSRPASAAAREKLPAVVLVGGTGQTDREENVGGVPVLGQLASALADAGFLTLRYDRRGIGQSGGRDETATLEDYAEDVRAVVKYVRKRKDVDSRRVGVLGFGEGGIVALLAAAGHGDIKAVVLASAPGLPGPEMVLEQQRHALARLPLTDADRQARVELQRRIQEAVLGKGSWEGIPPAVRERAETPIFRSRLAFDPAKVLAKTKQPLLIVRGGLDKELDAVNAERLEALARKRKRPAGEAVQLSTVPGLNHLLVPATTGEVDEYPALPDKTVGRAAVDTVAAWLRQAMPAKK